MPAAGLFSSFDTVFMCWEKDAPGSTNTEVVDKISNMFLAKAYLA